jgi:hypothetical protein
LSVGTDFLIILLKGSQIFTSLREFTLFHSLSNIPVNESSLGIHKIELVIDSGEDLCNCSGIGQHKKGSGDLGKITSRNGSRGLRVKSTFESSGAPIDELNGSLSLHNGNGVGNILRNDVSTVHKAAGHVLSVSGVAFSHHIGRLKDGVGKLSSSQGLVVSLLSSNDGSIRAQHEMDSGIRHQVSLELVDIHIEGSLESQRGSERGDQLGNQSVQIGVVGSFDIQGSFADLVNGLVIQEEGDIGVLQKRVSAQNRVVGLHDGSGDLRRWVDTEIELGFLSVIDGKSLQEQRTEARSSASSNGVEDEESLESSATISNFSDSLKGNINELLSNGVVTTSVVVGSIFLSRKELVGIEKLSISSASHFVDDGGLQIDKDGSRNVLSSRGLGEESIEGIDLLSRSFVGGHHTVGLDSMFQAVEFPAAVSELDSSLTDVNGDDFTHGFE